MIPLTPREQALLGYFYQIATDPRVRAAGASLSLSGFKDAVLSCVAEDVPGVGKFVLRGAVNRAETPVRQATRSVAETVLGGTVSSKTSGALADEVEGAVAGVFRRLEKWLERNK